MSETTRDTPFIVLDTVAESVYSIDSEEAAHTLRQAGVQNIAAHTIAISSEPRFNGGATAPKWLDRLLNRSSAANKGPGSIIHIHTTTKLRPNPRTPSQLNDLLTHEAEHVAQIERRDKRLVTGLATMVALTALGGYVGNRVTADMGKPVGLLATTLCGLAGYKIGYQLAAHEVQARAHARAHTSRAFRTN